MHPAEFDARYSEGGRYRLYHDRSPDGVHELTIRDRKTDLHRRTRTHPAEDIRYVIEEMMHDLRREEGRMRHDHINYMVDPRINPCSTMGDRVGSTGPTKTKDASTNKLLLLTN